jgi:plasmid replication initiation protein
MLPDMNISKIKNSLVVSSNDLVHAKYNLSLWQKRVFVYAISQLEKEDAVFKPLRIEIAEVIRFFKASSGTKNYNAIIEAPKNLDRTIEIPYFTAEGGLRYGFVKLLQSYTIPADAQSHNQYIEIQFNSDLRTHLLDLREKFLKYDIRNVIELQSTYSFRMFEILKSYEFRHSIELDIDYLREILEVTDKYTKYKDFRIYIIDKAQSDLLKYCDICFTYEERKGNKGKKIESLIFHIRKNSPGSQASQSEQAKGEKSTLIKIVEKREKSTQVEVLAKGEKSTENTEKSIEPDFVENPAFEQLIMELSPVVVTKFGVSLRVFMQLAEKNTEATIRQAVQLTEKAMQSGRVERVAGFFVEAVRGNYQDSVNLKKQSEAHQAADRKAKAETAKKMEQAAKLEQEQAIRKEIARKIQIIKDLVAQQSPLIDQAISDMQRSMFSGGYDDQKTIEENLETPMFSGVFMNFLIKLDPSVFVAKQNP